PQAYSVTIGIRQGDVASVYEALLSTVERVMKLPVPTDRKVHLLLLVFKSYNATFDLRRLRQLRAGVCEGDEPAAMALPLCVTSYGLLAKIYEMTPKRLHRVLTCFTNGIKYFYKRERFKAKGNWSALPEHACSFFDGDDCSVSRFVSSLGECSIRGSGVRQEIHA
ncbi:MAG: hypothetical protein ACYTAS_20605, partial [Planctomycetota bacterium]